MSLTAKSLSLEQISAEYRQQVSVQSYGRAPQIEGVQLVERPSFTDDGGRFCELLRLGEDAQPPGLPGFTARQINLSEVLPGAVKAWHMHFAQEDLWFVPPGDRLLAGLLDLREGSPTCGLSQRLVLGAGKSHLLYIPRGVAHGVANPWQSAGRLLYLVNQHFSPQNPDERRLPWDRLGADFWEIAKG